MSPLLARQRVDDANSRVRRLTVRSVAVSRFWNYFAKNDGKAAARPVFEMEGEARDIWPPSTRPPDPIAKIEFLPAFVYITEEGPAAGE
jgi:hypothetical protein